MYLLKTSMKVKNIEIHNRLVMAPMECRRTDEKGEVTEEMLKYYDERTKDGAFGLVVTEHHFVSPEGRASDKQLSIADDSKIESNRRLAELVHKNGSAILMQLGHAGMMANPLSGDGEVLSCNSLSINFPMVGEVSAKEMSVSEIKRIVKCFSDAAVRAKKAGFDGIEVHAAHGYLLSQFYSPITNHRKDEYNGESLEGRLRFHVEAVRAIREAVGKDFVISVRFGAYDYKENGSKLEEIPVASKMLAEAGADILSISCGMGGAQNIASPEEGSFRELSEIVKKNVHIPVITAGNIHTFSGADQLLQKNKADMVAIGRPVYRDADFARNMMREE